MNDYAQPLLNACKSLKELEESILHKEYEKSFNAVIDAEAELMKLKNWIWRNMRD